MLWRLIQACKGGKRARSCTSSCLVSQISPLPCFTTCIPRRVGLQLEIGTSQVRIWSKGRSGSCCCKVRESAKPQSSSSLHDRWIYCLQCLQRGCMQGQLHWLSPTRSPAKVWKVSRTSISYCYGQLSNSSWRRMAPSLDSSNVLGN